MNWKRYTAGIVTLAVALFMIGVSPAFADTLGYTSIGANDFSAGTANGINNPVGLLITVPSSGTISKITAYVATTITSKSITAKLYNGSAGSLGSLVATTNASTVTTTFGWVDFTFATPPSVTAQTYWIEWEGYGGDGPGTAVGHIKYDTGGAANSAYDKLDNGTPSYETNQYSMYATFTSSGGGGSTTVAPTFQQSTGSFRQTGGSIKIQ